MMAAATAPMLWVGSAGVYAPVDAPGLRVVNEADGVIRLQFTNYSGTIVLKAAEGEHQQGTNGASRGFACIFVDGAPLVTA
jgi:hypothetical protein